MPPPRRRLRSDRSGTRTSVTNRTVVVDGKVTFGATTTPCGCVGRRTSTHPLAGSRRFLPRTRRPSVMPGAVATASQPRHDRGPRRTDSAERSHGSGHRERIPAFPSDLDGRRGRTIRTAALSSTPPCDFATPRAYIVALTTTPRRRRKEIRPSRVQSRSATARRRKSRRCTVVARSTTTSLRAPGRARRLAHRSHKVEWDSRTASRDNKTRALSRWRRSARLVGADGPRELNDHQSRR